MKPRPYQQELINGAVALWRAGHRRIAAVAATGAGKTVVFSHVAEMSLGAGHPVLILAHRRELIAQAIDKVEQIAPHRRVGKLQGTTKQYRAEVVVGSIQTAGTPTTLALLRSRNWGLIIVDETHHVTAPSYMNLLRELRAFEPGGPLVLGVTATLTRADGQALGQVFEEIVEPRVGLLDLIRQGFLVPPRGVRVKIADLDLDRVRRVAGDFDRAALGRAMSEAMAPKRIIEAWHEHAAGRPTIAFLPTIALSIEQAQAFTDAGVTAVHLDGKTPDADREQALKDFREGRILVLCNVGLFLEGTDLPMCSCVILGRMTSSPTVYTQQVGRGLRLHPGKVDCVILDPSGVTKRHKLATLATLDGVDRTEDIPDELLIYEDDETAAHEPVDTDNEADTPPPVYADGDLAHELVDLFGQSHTSWLRTPGGTWFVPAGNDGFVYLLRRTDDRERYDLRWAVNHANVAGDRTGLIQADMEIGYAMAAGDEYIAARPLWMAARDEPWRKERTRGGRTRGEVWDDRAIVRAGAVLDR